VVLGAGGQEVAAEPEAGRWWCRGRRPPAGPGGCSAPVRPL